MKCSIPYRIVGQKFYDRREIKDITAYLRVIHNPADDVSLRRIINVPKRNIGDTTIDRLQAWAGSHNINLMEAVRDVDSVEDLSARAVSSVKKFYTLLEKYIMSESEYSVPSLVMDLLETTGYLKELEQSGEVEDESRMENLQEFVSVAEEFDRTSEDKSLGAFLEGISLISDTDTLNDEDHAVIIMTLHSAKGLEFPIVFMVGMEQGVFPHFQSMEDEEEIEEERRLCYVGMTRAREKLYMSYAYQRTLFGRTQCNAVSEFMDEIPKNCIEGMEKKTVPRREKIVSVERSVNVMPPQVKREGSPSGNTNEARMGRKINHKKWGRGIIVAVQKKEDDYEITIAFDRQGIKKLSARYAPIEYID
jgi:DNA helicase-2/ATP-dependent DNA helicase PcrA